MPGSIPAGRGVLQSVYRPCYRSGRSDAHATDERCDLLTVIAYMRAKAGREAELREALEALIKPTIAERGCVNYDLPQGVEDPAVFFYENWESADDLDAHLDAPHLWHFSSIMGDLLDEQGLTITPLHRIA
jgi:quinol monooxygenase YgiN